MLPMIISANFMFANLSYVPLEKRRAPMHTSSLDVVFDVSPVVTGVVATNDPSMYILLFPVE
ncbi:hypothetical protein ACI8B_210080 [Acinetobacter proteolyticus]|uniref:Uncharacterized protein n=1 Tax=Acinetobacter proteolyticus TaxID=1776741 RepID=A0A653K5R8_9GAMM|nr:hypothetical protein ACI8B_210080 [Acinetobacter proteolyticus]